MSDTELVKVVNDSGKRNQWALGKLFYRKEGGKNRLHTKTLLATIAVIFGIVMLIGLFKEETSETLAMGDSPVKLTLNKEEGKTIDVTKLAFEETREVSSPPASAPVKQAGRNAPLRLAGFEKVSRGLEIKIPPGTMAKARLASGASEGPIRALLTEDIIVNGETLVKEGTIIIGQGSSGEERLMVRLTHLVFSDGNHMRIDAQACDLTDKMPGLIGSNVKGQALKLSGALGLGFLGGTAIGLQKRQAGTQGDEPPSMQDALLNGVAVASLEQAQSMTSDLKNTNPLFEVPEGRKFFVLFAAD